MTEGDLVCVRSSLLTAMVTGIVLTVEFLKVKASFIERYLFQPYVVVHQGNSLLGHWKSQQD